jgi:two-component system sensor kinase FixL
MPSIYGSKCTDQVAVCRLLKDRKVPFPLPTKSELIALVALALAVAIFIIDTFTPLGIAVAALYAIVVVLAARLISRAGVLAVAWGLLALTVLSYAVQHGPDFESAAFVRCLVSLLAISITTFLALKTQAAATALHEQAELLDVTHDSVFARNMDDVITYWNRGAEEMYGWKRNEAVGRVSHELMRTKFPVPLEEISAELSRTGRWEGELVHTSRDGKQIDVASRWSLQRDERMRPVAILETNNDVTAAKHAQAALHSAQAELAHVTRITTLGEMSASIAHEVNQPLAAIVTHGEASLRWLKRDAPVIDEALQAIGRIISDANRASDVIRRIRELAKKAEPEVTSLDINDVIEEVAALVRHEALSHRVAMRLKLAPHLPQVLGDRIRLQQVIINLLMNGLQAMAKVGDRPRVLFIRTQLQEPDKVLVSVEDVGIGMEAESAEKLFTAFYTTKPNGMGMGLSICRSIIEAHGGRIWAARNSGPGMTFQFTVSAAGEQAR